LTKKQLAPLAEHVRKLKQGKKSEDPLTYSPPKKGAGK
jgi:hypothetical protein